MFLLFQQGVGIELSTSDTGRMRSINWLSYSVFFPKNSGPGANLSKIYIHHHDIGYPSFSGVSVSKKSISYRCHQVENSHYVHHSVKSQPGGSTTIRMIQSAGISPSFVANFAARKDRTQSAVTQHEIYIRHKAVRVLQGAHWNNLELLWIVMIQIWLSQSGTRIRLSNWSTKEILQPRDILSYFRPGLLCQNSALVGRKLQIESKYDMVMINLPWRSLDGQAAPTKPPRIGSKPF